MQREPKGCPQLVWPKGSSGLGLKKAPGVPKPCPQSPAWCCAGSRQKHLTACSAHPRAASASHCAQHLLHGQWRPRMTPPSPSLPGGSLQALAQGFLPDSVGTEPGSNAEQQTPEMPFARGSAHPAACQRLRLRAGPLKCLTGIRKCPSGTPSSAFLGGTLQLSQRLLY